MSQPTAAAVPAPDDQMARRVVGKVSRRLIPFMALLYFINYLDRTNIGFAKLTMSKELQLTETMFGLASGIFFAGYLLLEVPSNLALHRFGARRWIARIMITWGIVAAAMAFVPNATWLLVLRALLGIAEAGFFPGMILYLTFWLPRRQRTRMTGFFMLAIPLSSVLGSPLSGLLMQYSHNWFGMSGWRNMFLIEGVPAIILAFVTWFYLTDRPAEAKWLEPAEREWLQATLDAEDRETAQAHHWPLKKSLTNPRILGLAFVYFAAVYGLYALSFFLPSIVADFSSIFNTKFSLVQTGLIVAVPYLFGCVALVWWSHHSDRTDERVWHVAAPLILAGVAVPVALFLDSPFAVMAAMTVTAIGIFATLPVFWYLPTTFLTGAAAAGGIALINSLGNAAGFFAPYITGFAKDATGDYKLAMFIVGGVMIAGAVLTLVLKAAPTPDRPVAAQVSDGIDMP